MNCIIVGNQPESAHLEGYVTRCSSLNLIGKYNDPESAVHSLSEKDNIGLAFIDIMSTGVKSLDLFDRLSNPPYVIVVSSTGLYARSAFDYNVVDYLIKPLDYSRFTRAVDRSIRLFQHKSSVLNENREVFVKKESSLVKLKMVDIVYIEALENYVTVVTADKKHTFLFTMKGMESQVPADVFIRIHRSFIINKKMIKTIYDNSLDLNVGPYVKNFPLGKSFKANLMNDIAVIDKRSLPLQNRFTDPEFTFNNCYDCR